MSRKKVNTKLAEWHRKHKGDAEYRDKRDEGSRRHLAQLYRDATLGRLVRTAIAGIVEAVRNLEDEQ